MNNLTLNEKKAFYVLVGVFVLFVFEYTLFDLRVISSTIEDILSIFILGAIGMYVYSQPRAIQKTRNRLAGYYIAWLLVCAAIYLILYFGCGLMFGFGMSPYKRSIGGIITNVLIFGSIIVLKEWIRNFVINKSEKHLAIIFGAALVLLYTAIEVNIMDILSARSVEEFTIGLSEKLLPVLALNIFMTYVCYVAGFIPAMAYMLVVNVPIWFFNSLPNLEWIVVAVLGVAFPLIALVALIETVHHTTTRKSLKNKRIKSDPKTGNVVVWIFVGVFCIVVAFFTAGLLNVFPTVLVSGSMSPSINRGDVVLIKKISEDDEIYLNDVVIYNAGEFDVVHRVVDIYEEKGTTKYITKGDDNELNDKLSIEIKNIGGVVIARIPYLGLPRLLLESGEYEQEINGG